MSKHSWSHFRSPRPRVRIESRINRQRPPQMSLGAKEGSISMKPRYQRIWNPYLHLTIIASSSSEVWATAEVAIGCPAIKADNRWAWIEQPDVSSFSGETETTVLYDQPNIVWCACGLEGVDYQHPTGRTPARSPGGVFSEIRTTLSFYQSVWRAAAATAATTAPHR